MNAVKRPMTRPGFYLVLGALGLVSPASALAYVGPGAGLTAIGSAIALVGAILLGIVGFVWYPVKRLLRRRSETDERDDEAPSALDENDRDQPEKVEHP